MVYWPTSSDAVLSVASSTPLTTASATGGAARPSIVNVTVPVGVPAEPAATVAVKVTAWPAVAGSADEVSFVVVAWSGGGAHRLVQGRRHRAGSECGVAAVGRADGVRAHAEGSRGERRLVHAVDHRQGYGRLRLAVEP